MVSRSLSPVKLQGSAGLYISKWVIDGIWAPYILGIVGILKKYEINTVNAIKTD
tara:strand:- start:204 stop:365 length:162 start_codon:yes stop_codon:yes gene_type:complete